MPGTMLVPDTRVSTDEGEPDSFMQTGARAVGERDARVRLEVALQLQQPEQCRVKRAACAAAAMGRTDVHRRIDRPGISGALPVAGCIGIPGHASVVIQD